MENAGSWGNLVAQGAIVLFLLFLLALFIRTSMMVGSIVLLALGRSRKPTDEDLKGMDVREAGSPEP